MYPQVHFAWHEQSWGLGVLGNSLRLLHAQPQQAIDKFTRLSGQGHGQVFRRVVRVPVALVREPQERHFEPRDIACSRKGGAKDELGSMLGLRTQLFFCKGYPLSSSSSEVLDTCPVLYDDFADLGRGRTTLSYVTGSVTTACCSNR